MSLPQLIGLRCVSCLKEIASASTAGFCEECGNPVHHQCRVRDVPPLEGKCSMCAGDPQSDTAKEVRGERTAEAQQRATGRACPFCGSGEVVSVPPLGMISFSKDRFCNRCRTQYTPPTPVWGSLIMIVIGGIFLLVSIGGFAFLVASESIGPRVISGVVGGSILGGAMLAFGIRSIGNTNKIVPTPTNNGDGP